MKSFVGSGAGASMLLLLLISMAYYIWVLRKKATKAERMLAELTDKRLSCSKGCRPSEQKLFLGLAHELRTPLHVILSAIQLQDEGDGAGNCDDTREKYKRICGVVKSNSYRLLRVINNLIDINLLEAGALSANPVYADLGQETRRVFEAAKPWFGKKTVRLSYEEADGDFVTACDPSNYQRVLMNLLSNALKFTEPGGDVLIAVVRNIVSGDIVVSVKDSGCGIPPERRQGLFESYSGFREELVRETEGNGLGLAIVKGLVTLEGGTVQLVNGQGRGSEFRLAYPQKDATVPAKESGHVHRDTLDYMAVMEFSEILQ